MSRPLSPTRVQLIAMFGDLLSAAQQLTLSGSAAPEQQAFLRSVGSLAADAALWPDENFSVEDGVVYIILDRLSRVHDGMPLIAGSPAAAEAYCRKRVEDHYGAGKVLFTDREIGGVKAYYANGTEVFNVMPEYLVG